MHDRRGAGQPVVLINRSGGSAPPYPGALAAPADATRRWLFIQTAGAQLITVYARSGSDPPVETGIALYPYAGSMTLSDEDDPDLVVAEWWCFSNSTVNASFTVVEEILR